MTTKRQHIPGHDPDWDSTNQVTFDILAQKYGAESARKRLLLIGADEDMLAAVWERHLADHAHEKYAIQARLHQWDDPEP